MPKGYLPDTEDTRDYVFGAEKPVVLPSGNWREVPIAREVQIKAYDTYGCVSFTLLNAIEKLAHKLYGTEWNKSDRFTYIASDTVPNVGNSPRNVANSIRKQGVVDEDVLPFNTETIEEFNSPKPLTLELLRKGEEFVENYEFTYEYIRYPFGIPRDVLKEALKRSPIGIAVYAWVEENGRYVRKGNDTHFTLLENVKENGELECFDSYPPFGKTLAADFPIYTAVSIGLREKTEEEKAARKTWLQSIALLLQQIAEALGLIQKQVEAKNKEKKNKIEEFAKAIQSFEGYGTPSAKTITENMNPGAIKGRDGKFLKFASYEEGFAYLKEYIIRVAVGKHAAYPKAGETTIKEFFYIYAPSHDNNAPEIYARYIAKKIGEKVETKIKELI